MISSVEVLGKPPGKWGGKGGWKGKGGGWKGKGWHHHHGGRRWWGAGPTWVDIYQQYVCPVMDKGVIVDYVLCPYPQIFDAATVPVGMSRPLAGLDALDDFGRNGRGGGRGGRGGRGGGGRGFGLRGGRGRGGGRHWGRRRGWGRGWWWGGGPTWIEIYNQYLCPIYDKGILVDYVLCPFPEVIDAAAIPQVLSGPELGAEGESCISNVAIVAFTVFSVAAFGAVVLLKKQK